ncbi:MAG: Mur ligase domain-containing protein [Candidatus Paceibacterota bacterium]
MTDISTIQKIHFIGIGGIGMSGLARLFLHEGKQVSGSDRTPSDITSALEEEGVAFFSTQEESNISDDIDIVVYTEAMAKDHPEMEAARRLGVPMMNYFEALATVANEYYLVAVAGAHGKTTTTAMLIDILEEAGLDPTAIVGSLRSKTGSNFRAGRSKYFVVEACEYKEDFKYLRPSVLVVTNIEHEHVDYYKTLGDVQAAFRRLAESVPEDGAVVAQTADSGVKPVIEGLPCTILDYKDHLDLSLQLRQPGVHNQLNAAAASAAASFLGVEAEVTKNALENFAGTWRRFEYKGDVNGAPVYDDYAHHPTEIAAAIAGVREKYPKKKLTVVFQPHTYTRTHALFDEFVSSLSKADRVFMVPIYAAREENVSGVSSEQVIEAVAKKGTEAQFFYTLDAAALAVEESVSSEDVVVVMGAGDVTQVAHQLIQ